MEVDVDDINSRRTQRYDSDPNLGILNAALVEGGYDSSGPDFENDSSEPEMHFSTSTASYVSEDNLNQLNLTSDDGAAYQVASSNIHHYQSLSDKTASSAVSQIQQQVRKYPQNYKLSVPSNSIAVSNSSEAQRLAPAQRESQTKFAKRDKSWSASANLSAPHLNYAGTCTQTANSRKQKTPKQSVWSQLRPRKRVKTRPRSKSILPESRSRGYPGRLGSGGGESMLSSDEEHPPHVVYESFPEYKEETPESGLPTLIGELKRKFNGAVTRKDEHSSMTSQTDEDSPRLSTPRSMGESHLECTETLPTSATMEEGRTRKVTIGSSASLADLNPVEHSEANKTRIIHRYNLLRRRLKNKEHLQRYWMPDNTSSECYNCLRPFTKIRRRHHCRICGNIFCNNCCSNYLSLVIGVDVAKKLTERTCNFCRETAEDFCSPNFESQTPMTPSSSTGLPFSGTAALLKAPDVPSWVKKLSLIGRTESYNPNQNEEIQREKLLQDCLVDLERIWQEMMESVKKLPFVKVRYRLRTYTDCMSGKAIVDWLRQNEKISGHEADLQGLWLGQALLDAKFLTPLNRKNTEFRDSSNVFYRSGGENAFVTSSFSQTRQMFDLSGGAMEQDGSMQQHQGEPVWVQHVHDSSSEESDKSEVYHSQRVRDLSGSFSTNYSGTDVFAPSACSMNPDHRAILAETFTESYQFESNMDPKHKHSFNRQSSTISHTSHIGGNNDFVISLPTHFEDAITNGSTADQSPQATAAKQERDEAILNERQSVQEIVRNSYLMHMIAFLHQLLWYYGVSFDWAQYIFKFAKSLSETVRPSVRAKDNLDIRKYIKVKSIPGGSKEDSRIINGLAFTGNVTCKGMSEFTKKPSYVLLCRGSIECNNHRDSCGDPTRLVSLQTVWGQKKDYNQLCVKRILSVTPSVSLVLQEFTVVPRVQNLLMDANIAVVKNVKKSNLTRLSRILDCEVAERVENLGLAETKPTKPGAYKQFYVETIRVGYQNKSMCVFDDCAKDKFATVVLRGSEDVEELRSVKQILLEMVMANYNRVLERSYLIDANAQQRTYFKHLPFTAKIMEFTSKYLWKILPENQLSILYKRSDVVQSLVTSSQNVPQCTAAAGGGNKMGRKIHLTNIRSSSVSWEGGPPYDPILYEPHENSLFYVHRQQFRSTVLSTSPHVLIDCPFLESNLGFNSPLRRYIFKESISNGALPNESNNTSPSKYWSGSFPGETPLPPLFKYDGDCEKLNDVEPEFDLEMLPFDESAIFDAANIVELPPHPFLSYVTSKSIDGPEFQNLLADFRLRGYSLAFDDIRNIALRHKMRAISKRKAFEAKMNKRLLHHQSRKSKPDCLDYRYHQKINLLVLITSNQPTKDPNKFCCFLVYRKFHFYMHHDLTLGQFLERLCFNDRVCINSQCELPAEVHTRRFLNGNYCLQVSIHNPELQNLKQPPSDILMWNFCPYCKKLSQISQMSDFTWNYSFGKFLENCLSAFNLEVSNISNINKSSEDPAAAENQCCHSLFREHHQYFMFKKRIAAFRVFSVGVYEIAFPEKFHPAGNYVYHVKTFAEEQKTVLAKLEAAVSHIYQRINTCNEHLKSRAENAQNSSASAKRRAYVQLLDHCCSFESMLVAEKEACLHSIKKEEEKCRKTNENSLAKPTCAPSNAVDWLRFDSILMMKHHVSHFCDGWNSNLAKLAKAESEFKNYFYKERAFNIPLLRTNTPEDVKVMGSSPMGSDKENSGKFESSMDASSGGSKTPNGSINDIMFEANSDVENTFTSAGVNSDDDSGNVTTISQPISVSSSASVNNGVIFDVDIGKEGQGRCVEKGIHFVIDRLTLPNNGSPASSTIEDSYDMIDNTRSEGSNLRKNSVHSTVNKRSSNFLSRVPSTETSFASTPSLTPASNGIQNGADVSATTATANDINKRITVTFDGQNFAGTLKWVGYLGLSDPRLPVFEMGGIELDEPQPRAGNGVYNGVCVFDCPPQKAIFVPLVGIFLLGNENTISVQDLNVSTSEAVKANVPKSKLAELASMSPFSPDEHFISSEDLPPLCPILIRESQPASIIAFSMASNIYRGKVAVLEAEHFAALQLETITPANRYTPLGNSNNNSEVDLHALQNSPSSTTTGAEPSVAAQVGQGPSTSQQQTRLKQQFVEHSFSTNDKKCFFYCKTWYPVEFKNLRKKAFSVKEGEDIERCFVKCLGQSSQRYMTAGRSKALFFETESHRFIIKSLRAAEVQDFVDPVFASSYFNYLNDCLDNGKPSALCKIYGVFRVSFKNTVTDQSQPRSQQSIDLVVMENLFYGRDCSRKFDLKGVHKILSPTDHSYKKVLDDKMMILDQHMTTVMQEDPIYTRPHSKHFLMEAIARDGKFLAENGRIDYSLLIGLDDSKNEMVVGIVDYVRKFGLDKRFEMVSKTVKIYFSKTGAQPADPREMMPTIVSPDLYYERFIIQMQQFILAVPDRWFGLESGPAEKWTCGLQGQGWSAYTGGRVEKVQNLDPYPSYLNYWDPILSSRSNAEEN